ncbi:CapA family protein [Staphylococcus succinus]|uniref:CapA family protein n=1 Tax=Staphylococcus succinus TaxID=61015 RepID=UPI000D1E9CFE|nr:CapA family protein [Staphylococcus succinus]MBU0438189.1 CapA family protein [Staphylococcus succinus]PTJ81850.1 capsule biosynthesis protein CapA [Staphylococcus succinus]
MMKKFMLLLTLLVAFICSLLLIINLTILLLSVTNSSKKADFVAVGDNLIHPVVYNNAKTAAHSYDFKPMYAAIKSYIKDKDVAFVNQESPMGGDDIPYSGFKRFNTPSSVAKDLVDTGFNLINGSNNHSLDQGTHGVEQRIQTWNKYKKEALFTGTFNSKESRDKIHVFKSKGIKISLLSYTFGTNGLKTDKPYQINYFNKTQMKKDIHKAKKHSDLVMVSAHWGNEGKHKPNKMQRHYAQFLANQNVDVVLGTHPHVIQPVKWVQGKNNHKTLVAYSLGNFLNGQETGTESNHLGGSIQFDIKKQLGQTYIDNVKWRSIVNHYETQNQRLGSLKKNFELYMLDDYTNDLAKKHGVQYQDDSHMSKTHLNEITKNVIDDEFLDKASY